MSNNLKPVIGNGFALYHGDAMQIIPQIRKVGLVVTDPPYKLTSGGNTTGKMKGKFAHGRYDNSGSIVQCDIDWKDFVPAIYDALEDRGHCYMMCNDKNVRRMLNAANKSGFRFHNLLVWDKGNATPNRWYMKNCEFTGFFYKGKAFYVRDMGAKQLLYVPQEPYGNHPTPKPTMLMRHYIEQSSDVGMTVLDPFMGSGSTGIAALSSGRHFIGIEKDPYWFAVAMERLLMFEQLQLGLGI